LRGRVDIERSLKIRSQEQRLRARTKTTLPTPGYYLKATNQARRRKRIATGGL
jgi:hypothetical protein